MGGKKEDWRIGDFLGLLCEPNEELQYETSSTPPEKKKKKKNMGEGGEGEGPSQLEAAHITHMQN